MKIAIVSKADQTAGGASRVAADLAREMLCLGHEVDHFVGWSSKNADQKVQYAYGNSFFRRLTVHASKVSRRMGFAETVPFEAPASIMALRSYDAVHFHDTSSSFSPLTLLGVSKFTKVAWTFHDCSPFTGGCIYPQMADCERYKKRCGDCPLVGEWPLDGLIDSTRLALSARKTLHQQGDITYIAPSKWMADTSFASGSIPRRPHVISNMVDTEVFAPAPNLQSLRSKLGLPSGHPVIAMSAGNVSDPRKDIRSSLETLRAIADLGAKPTAVLIGKPDPRMNELLGDIDFVSTGFVSNRHELAEWLSASDAFVTTSHADNQPLAIMEAMACGTPVYGRSVGGISEMVQDGINGRLMEIFSPTSLGKAIYQDIESGVLRSMREKTRYTAAERYSSTLFATAHNELYESMISKEHGQ